MSAASAPPVSRAGLLARRRSLQAALESTPWATAAGFAIAIAAVTLLGRLMMLEQAVWHRFFRGLSAKHILWIAPELGHDLVVVIASTLLLGAVLRALPKRVRWLGVGLGYLTLIAASLVVIISVPLYAALQTTLQLTQLLLAGGVRDLTESALGVVPVGVFVVSAMLLGAACFGVPWFAAWAQPRLYTRHIAARSFALALIGVALCASARLAPEEGSQVLQLSPIYEFVASVARFGMRRRAPQVDMSKAPHFDASLMFGKPAPAVPTDTLVDIKQLPLQRANVVLVVLESASSRLTGLWNGHPQDTPRLAEMSKHGLIFDQYYTSSPVSMKSLFTLNCASYPHTVPEAETYTNPSIDCQSISELLKQRGYRTALFHGGRFSYTRKDAFFRHRQFDVLRDAELLVHRRQYASVPWGVDDRAVIDDTLDWLDQGNPQTPFFVEVIFLAPHEPYVVHDTPQPFGDKTDADRYRNATLFIDSQVGRLWDWVNRHGKANDTLFVIVGDHGEAFGEHPGDALHGGRIYDATVRTPLMLVQPRLFSGKRSDRVGNHVDLVPTVLDVLGMPKPARHQGGSLLRGYKPHMIYFYADWQRHYLGLRDGQWKYIYNVDRERHELFDLDHDRDEKDNLAYRYPAQVEAYAQRVLGWEGFYQELIPNYEHYVNGQDSCASKNPCYLDELEPVLQHGILRRNLSGSGFKLQLGRDVFAHGLGVAPLSILRYNIRGDGFRRLKGGVGHHTQGGPANLSLKVSTEIYLDDQLIWSSGKLSADDPPKWFDLSIADGAVLELIGYDVDAEDWRDYIDWVDIRLQR